MSTDRQATIHSGTERPVLKQFNRRQFIASSVAITGSILIPLKAHCAEIREMSGTVFVNRKRAEMSTPIEPGDSIVASHDGHISFTIGEDGFMVRPGTALKLESGTSVVLTGLRLLTGGLLSVFARGMEKRIVTSTATIGIRGTGLYLDVAPAKTYFCTCYGETTFTAGGDQHVIRANHHEAHNIDFDMVTGVMSMKATGVIGHTDDELRQLEAYFGRKPEFDL